MPFRTSIPPVTRGLLAALLVLTILQLSFNIFYTYPLILFAHRGIYYPWGFVTTTFVERGPLGLVFSALALFYGGKYLERAWGGAEFAKFMLFAAMLPNVVVFLLYSFLAVLPVGEGWTYVAVDVVSARQTGPNVQLSSTPINGSIAVQAAFLVSFKQLVPEHTVAVARDLIRVRIKHFPALFILVNTFSWIFLRTHTAGLLSWSGFMTSWVYLRFYRKADTFSAATGESNVIRGDASDTFAFAQFWPERVQQPIALLSDAVFNLLVTMRVCTPFSAEAVDAGNQQTNSRSEGGLPSLLNPSGREGMPYGGGRREEAERRRALALKALDQRLQAGTTRVQPANGTDARGTRNHDHDEPGDRSSSVTAPAQMQQPLK